MKIMIELLNAHPQVSDYKINIHQKESYEVFFVKGKLETVRRTNTCDKEITVYVDHENFKGEAQFFIYPSTTPAQIEKLIDEAVAKALLINNPHFTLPDNETGEYTVDSNFDSYEPSDLAALIANTVFSANTIPCAALNSVEVFINKHTETVLNSRSLSKTQVRYDAMVEAIPTYNGQNQSVELYEQYSFGCLDTGALHQEIADKMREVKARYEAVTPDFPIACNVILNKLELTQLFYDLAGDLNYATVYSHSNLYKKGDMIQSAPAGDRISIHMVGASEGNVRSSKFDSDGMFLGSIQIIGDGKAVNYYGSNRYGQYLGEKPTGNLGILCVNAGTATEQDFQAGASLEIVSMSGLQIDAYNDYIGGEVRLAYYHDGDRIIPVTGISVSGKLSEVLNRIHLSSEIVTHGSYVGPKKAILHNMKVF